MLTLTLTFMYTIVDLDTLVDKIIKYLFSFDGNKEILDSFLEAIVEVVDLGEVVELEVVMKLSRMGGVGGTGASLLERLKLV